MAVRVFTVGHGARSIDGFIELVQAAGVERIADVRTAPGSKRHPQFGRDVLAASLSEHGIAYEWWGEQLGGFRRARPDSRHVALRSAGFRGYADHMEGAAFAAGMEQLEQLARERPTAVMCAESLWWRCHRRLIADALVLRGTSVVHLFDPRVHREHALHPAARSGDDGWPVWDALAPASLF